MRILPAALLAVLLPAIAVDAQVPQRSLRRAPPLRVIPTPRSPEVCAAPGADKAAGMAKPVVPQKLGDLPPASAISTVWRFDEKGCPRPVILKRGIGANPERAVEPSAHAAPSMIR